VYVFKFCFYREERVTGLQAKDKGKPRRVKVFRKKEGGHHYARTDYTRAKLNLNQGGQEGGTPTGLSCYKEEYDKGRRSRKGMSGRNGSSQVQKEKKKGFKPK